MAETHDNTRPATGGTFSINRTGALSYFPIEKAHKLKPYMAISLTEKTDGSLVASLDIRFMGQVGELDDDD